MFQNANTLTMPDTGRDIRSSMVSKSSNLQQVFNPMSEAFNQINNSQVKAERSAESYAIGEADSIHQVMIDMEEAMMSMKLATQVRNKAVEAYQEIMRMQI